MSGLTKISGEAPEDARKPLVNITHPWPEPEPLVTFPKPVPYPLDALPDIIQGAVREVHSFVQAPLPMIATSALGAVSLASQGLVDIQRAGTLSGPTSLFTLTVAESGERKSTVDKYFTEAIRNFESEQKEALRMEVQGSRTAQLVWEAKRAGLLDKIKTESRNGKTTEALEEKLHVLEAVRPKPVKTPYLIRSDETPEHLAMALRDEWPSAGVISSEAGTVFGSHGMNADSVMRTLSQLNVLWDGGELQVGRITRESFRLDGVRLTISLQTQPDTLTEFLKKHGALARGNGFLARFLIAWPDSTQGYRPMTDPPDGWPALTQFNRHIRKLLETPLPLHEEGHLTPPVLRLSLNAGREWRDFHDKIEYQLRPGEPLSDIKDAASKLADNMARVAALLHVFGDEWISPVTVENVRAAIAIVSWHIGESRRLLGTFSLPEDIRQAVRLEDWMLTRCRNSGVNSVPTCDIAQYGPAGLRRKDENAPALAKLAEHNRNRICTEGRRKFVQVNPSLLEL